jgi:hypothetical protein
MARCSAGGCEFLSRFELRDLPRQRLAGPLRLIDDFDRELLAGESDQRAAVDERAALPCQIRSIGRDSAILVTPRSARAGVRAICARRAGRATGCETALPIRRIPCATPADGP